MKSKKLSVKTSFLVKECHKFNGKSEKAQPKPFNYLLTMQKVCLFNTEQEQGLSFFLTLKSKYFIRCHFLLL
jgi:hypothetical protein